MKQLILFVLFLFICYIKSSDGVQINGYAIGEDKLKITISGVGFKSTSKIKFQTTSTLVYNNEIDTGSDYSVLIDTFVYYNSSMITVVIPQTLMNCLFSVFDIETGIESNKLQLNLDMTPVFINTQTELINKSSLVITFYGNYLWKLNTFYEIVVNNSPCNGITGNITGFTNQYIQCMLNIPMGTDENQLKNIKLISTITIGNWNGVFNFYISKPTLNVVSLNNYRELMVSGLNLTSFSNQGFTTTNPPFIIYWNNEIGITESCSVYNEMDNLIKCIIETEILEQSTLNQSIPIKIKIYGVISNLINLQIRPIINIEQSNISILPLISQPISINGYYFLSSGGVLIVNLKNNITNEIGQCNNATLVDSTNIKCNLPELFVSLSTLVIVSINGIESDSIKPFTYLEPSSLYATYVNNNTIQISGNNVVSKANILYNGLPLQCIQSGEIGKSINCTFDQHPVYCENGSNCFSICSTSMVYNDGIFSDKNLYYYSPPIINSLLLNGTHIIVDAIILCDRISPVDYLSYYVAVDLDNTRITPLSYHAGIFTFPYAQGQLPNQDVFDIKFYFSTGFSSYKYQIIQPTIKSVSSQNGILTIYGDNLSKTTKFAYGITDISCDLPKEIVDPTSSDNSIITIINCYLPTSCQNENINCFTNCGEIKYYGTFYQESINFFVPPTINSLEITFNKTLVINGSFHCDLFSPDLYSSEIKLITNAKNDNGTNYQLLNYNGSIYTFQFNNKPQPYFNIFLSFFNVNSNGYQVNLPDPNLEGAEYINEQFIIIGNYLSTNAKISYNDEQLNCNTTSSITGYGGSYIIYNCKFSNSSTQCLSCINQCGFIKYQDQFSDSGINYRFFVRPILYDAVIAKKKNNDDKTFYLSFISINGSINCQDVPTDIYNQLNLLAHFEKSLVPFKNYSSQLSLFRFDFVEKQLTIPSKDSFNLYFSLGFDGIASNVLKINTDSIIDETDYTDFPNHSNLIISTVSTINIMITLFFVILL